MTKPSDFKPVESAQPHWIEWLTGVFSGVCVAALIGWIGFEALDQSRQGRQGPDLSVRNIGTQMRSDGYQVAFEVSNRAGATAAGVVVRGQIVSADAVVETVETTLDYVPMHSTAGGGLIFQHDPDDPKGQLRIAAIGYSDP